MQLLNQQTKKLYITLLSQLAVLAFILIIMNYFKMDPLLLRIASGSVLFQMLLAIWKQKK